MRVQADPVAIDKLGHDDANNNRFKARYLSTNLQPLADKRGSTAQSIGTDPAGNAVLVPPQFYQFNEKQRADVIATFAVLLSRPENHIVRDSSKEPIAERAKVCCDHCSITL